jgi:DNA-binding MarR family transcriptional regulator
MRYTVIKFADGKLVRLTETQWAILRSAESESLPGDGHRIRGAGAHRSAHGLETLGLVRVAIPADGRKARVHVTEKGRAVVRSRLLPESSR